VRASDYLQEILWSFKKQKLRTALTSTGIAIGAFAITIMVGLGQGVQSYIESQVMAFGNPNVVVVFPDRARSAEKFLDQITKMGKPAERIAPIDEDARKERRGGLWITPEQVEKLRLVPGVTQVAPLTWLEIDGIALADGIPEDAFLEPVALEPVKDATPPPETPASAPAPEPVPPAAPAPDAPPEKAPATAPSKLPIGPFFPRVLGGASRGGSGGSGDVTAATPVSATGVTAAPIIPAWKADFYQTDFAALSTHPLVGTPSVGRLPDIEAAAEVIISAQYAESFRLPASDLVGRTVAIRVPKLASIQQRFLFRDPTKYKDEHRLFKAKIVGLAERSLASRAVYSSLVLGREMARFQSQNQSILSDQKIGFQAHVRIADGADHRAVKKEIETLGLVAKSVDDQLADITRSFLVVKLALSLFGMIAVLVATFGIANTLLMAISERTREIGVMKALGATESTIRGMFAAEAAAIGLVGGLVGAVFAILLGMALNVASRRYLDAESFLSFYAFVFPWWLVLGAVAFSAVVGVLAGLYPANRAAKLDPIEALRYE